MAVAKEQIRQIISENNISSVADVYALLKESFKDILQELMEAELDATLGSILYNQFQNRQFIQRAIQSANFTLWNFFYCTLNSIISLFRNIIHVHISILQLIIGSHQQIAEKHFQILCCSMNSVLQIIIICSYQSISEIPGMLLERIIINFQSKRLHIFDNKDRCCSCISFCKWMNLPDV